MYLDIIAKTEYIADLFIDNMIYMKQWGGLGIEILCLSMFNFHHIFSLYILSIDLLNKCQWHLILYILLLVLDSYNIMNHYFLYLFKWVPKYHYGPKLRASVPNYIMNHYLLVQSQMSKWGTNLKVHILLWHKLKCPNVTQIQKSIYYYGTNSNVQM